MIKSIFMAMMLIFVCSCGFTSTEDGPGAGPQQNIDPLKPGNSSTGDFDGDLMSDKEEVEKGRNPKIADIPDVRVRFLQNYKITVKYKNLADGKEDEFVIDTNIHQDNPDFKRSITVYNPCLY